MWPELQPWKIAKVTWTFLCFFGALQADTHSTDRYSNAVESYSGSQYSIRSIFDVVACLQSPRYSLRLWNHVNTTVILVFELNCFQRNPSQIARAESRCLRVILRLANTIASRLDTVPARGTAQCRALANSPGREYRICEIKLNDIYLANRTY